MKTVFSLFSLCILFNTLYLFGQETDALSKPKTIVNYTAKGRVGIKGISTLSTSLLSSRQDDARMFQISLDARGEFFLFDNISLLPGVGYDYQEFSGNTSHTVSLAIAARYYTKPKIFVGAGYGYIFDFSGLSEGALLGELGYAHFFNSHFSIEPMFRFALFSEVVRYSVGVGVSYYF